MQLKSLLCFASVVAIAFGADIGGLVSDLNTVSSLMTTLHNEAIAFPESGATTADALAIFIAVAEAQAATETAANTAKAISTVSVTDGIAVLASVNSIFSLLEDCLVQTVAKKPSIDALGIPPLVLQELKVFGVSAAALADALVAFTPPPLLSQANAAEAALNAAFATAIAAFN